MVKLTILPRRVTVRGVVTQGDFCAFLRALPPALESSALILQPINRKTALFRGALQYTSDTLRIFHTTPFNV